MAIVTIFGRDWAAALLVMDFAWITTMAMAYYAILRRCISIHKEWMVRAYVVTFSFVILRLLGPIENLLGFGPTSHLEGATELWISWAVPLLVAEVILQFRRINSLRASSPKV